MRLLINFSKQNLSPTSGQPEAGFATPAATLVSLALAVVATAVTSASLMELRLAKADQACVSAEYALAGAHQIAALTVLGAKQQSRLVWTMSAAGEAVSVLAEPEGAKLTLAAGADLGGATLTKLAVTDAGALRGRLAALAQSQAPVFDLDKADASPLWRACARSIMSPYGQATTPTLTQAVTPITGGQWGRIGETWRIRLVSANGWADDRIVRFTGEAAHPAAVVERRFTKVSKGGATCENLFAPPPKT